MFDKADCDSKKILLKANLVLLKVDFEEGTSGLDLSNYSDLIIRSPDQDGNLLHLQWSIFPGLGMSTLNGTTSSRKREVFAKESSRDFKSNSVIQGYTITQWIVAMLNPSRINWIKDRELWTFKDIIIELLPHQISFVHLCQNLRIEQKSL